MMMVRHQASRSTTDLWSSSSSRLSAAAHRATLIMQTLGGPCQGAVRAEAYQCFGNMTDLRKPGLRSAVLAKGSNMNGNGSLKTVGEYVADEENETSAVRSRVFMLS